MATIHDGRPNIYEKTRKYSINSTAEEIEQITFPPSTELIQDEYAHEDNKMGLVYIFYSSADTENMLILQKAMIEQEYEVPQENIIKMTKREIVLNALQRIANEDNSSKTCLVVFILGTSIGDDLILPEEELNADFKNCITVKDVWINFSGKHCDSLRNKPKIFIFQGVQKPQYVQHDLAVKQVKTEYGFPAEADMLVIYNKVEPAKKNHFVVHFCNDLNEYGKEDDVIGIVTRFEEFQERPLIISTLTRKFFISPNRYRGHHYEYNLNYDWLVDTVTTLERKVDYVADYLSNTRKMSNQKRNSPNASMDVPDGRSRGTPTSSVLGKTKRTTSTSSTKSTTRTRAMSQPRWRF